MNTKTSLAIILTTMLLIESLNGDYWQGTGSGMNNTVITEIWTGFEGNLNTALAANSSAGYNNIVNGISGRLNARWDPAWNVVLILTIKVRDSILYGYAFRNQWMWYNGVPNTASGHCVTLIVWKDYNCKDWKNIADGVSEASSFTTAQKNLIMTEIGKMTSDGIKNDVWLTAFTMMDNLNKKTEFSSGGYSGGYSVIFNQDDPYVYGRVCRVGDGFFYSYPELDNNFVFPSTSVGQFYLFQTR